MIHYVVGILLGIDKMNMLLRSNSFSNDIQFVLHIKVKDSQPLVDFHSQYAHHRREFLMIIELTYIYNRYL